MITIICRKKCPYCIEMFHYLDELKRQDKYKDIIIKVVDEVKESSIANKFDYFFVPAIYFKEKRIHEGKIGPHSLREILDKYLDLEKK